MAATTTTTTTMDWIELNFVSNLGQPEPHEQPLKREQLIDCALAAVVSFN